MNNKQANSSSHLLGKNIGAEVFLLVTNITKKMVFLPTVLNTGKYYRAVKKLFEELQNKICNV